LRTNQETRGAYAGRLDRLLPKTSHAGIIRFGFEGTLSAPHLHAEHPCFIASDYSRKMNASSQNAERQSAVQENRTGESVCGAVLHCDHYGTSDDDTRERYKNVF